MLALSLVAIAELGIIVFLVLANRTDQRHFTDVLVTETAPKYNYARAMRDARGPGGILLEEIDVDDEGDYPSA